MTFSYDKQGIVCAISMGEDERAAMFCEGEGRTVEVIPGAPPRGPTLGIHADKFRRRLSVPHGPA